MKKVLLIGLVAAAGFGLYGCNQDKQSVSADSALVDASSARLAASLTGGGKVKLTKVDVSTLPAEVLAYIATNYAGAEIKHAGKDADGNLVVMVSVASTPKALLFDSANAFKQELTFEGKGPGGGPKGGLTKIDVATLPSTVTSYVSTNYAGAEIKGAAKDKDSNIVVMLVQDNVPKTLLFDASGNFKQVLEMKGGGKGPGGPGRKKGDWTEIAKADLPQVTTSYITTTYPNATIKRAAKSKTDGKFTVLITTSDNQHVALLFAADGTFEKALTKK